MYSKIVLAVLAVAFSMVQVQCVYNVKCTGDVMSKPKIDNNDTCTLACGPNEKCSCDDTKATKQFKNCNQQCRGVKMPNNKTVEQCDDMDCKGFKTCYQGCFGTRCPKAYCKARESCNQECNGDCTHLVCSSPTCIQMCNNCTMECTSEVKECGHYCMGGQCKSICNKDKQSCKCETYSNPKTKCYVVSHGFKMALNLFCCFIGFFIHFMI